MTYSAEQKKRPILPVLQEILRKQVDWKNLEDSNALQPESVKDIQTQFGLGIVGYWEDGITLATRPGSKTGRSTLEIRRSNRKTDRIRY